MSRSRKFPLRHPSPLPSPAPAGSIPCTAGQESRMTSSKRSESEPGPRPEEAPHSVQGHLEDDARGWIADLAAAHVALRRGIDAGETPSLLEALERLERLELALHQAPEQIAADTGRRTAELASAAMGRVRRIGELETDESELASTND